MYTRSIDIALLVLRLAFGFALFYFHGLPKLLRMAAGNFQFGDPLGIGAPASLVLAGLAEGICTLLVMVGLFTRIASIPIIITMAVAFFIVHIGGGDAWSDAETSFLFMMGFIAIAIAGPGSYSLDERWRARMV